MERIFRKFLSIAALLSVVAVEANNVTPTLVLRSQGFHGDRQKMVGEVGHTHLYDMESWYGTFDIGVGYSQSFRNDRLVRCLFGTDASCGSDCDGGTIKVQGSGVTSRDAKAWLADYLYMNCDFDGSFTFSPKIKNVVVDLDFYLGLDEWANGLYFRVYGPVNWTKWETGFCGGDDAVSTASCSAGYLTPSGSEVLLTNLNNYFGGSAPASVDGITFQGLRYAKMPACDESKTGFADLRMILGWDFLQDEDYHLGVNVQAAAPTGTKRNATYVMQPVVGNGNHWELGGGLTGHYVFWRSEDEEKHFGFYLDAALTHLFKAEEGRTFDLRNKDNSRYMLAAKFTKTITQNLTADANTADNLAGNPSLTVTHQFANEYAPVANLTSYNVDVSIGVQADIVAMFNFTSRGFSWDLGYDFWGRSCESIDCASSCDPCNLQSLANSSAKDNFWGLKGDARMFGYELGVAADYVNLSATNNAATINAGSAQTTAEPKRNFGVDATAAFAYGDASGGTDNNRLVHTPTTLGGFNVDAEQIKTSTKPVILKLSDVEQQETKGISHTVFTHLSYTWDRDNWVPYLGVGGSAEFGKGKSCGSDCDTECNTSCATECDSCITCAVSQWSVWVKGGLSFN